MTKYTYTSNSLGIITLLKAVINFTKSGTGRKQFAQKIANFFSIEAESVFLFASARMGLYTFLKSIDIAESDEVILPGYTCVVVSNAVKYSKAKAVYADINIDTLNIDYDDLVSKITDKTKVIVISHNFGLACEYIEKLKEQYPHIYIIEDCAHTFGSKFQGRFLGTLADASFISHEYSKVITTGMGGTFILNNKKLLPKFQMLYSQTDEYDKKDIIKIYINLFFHTFTSYKYSVWSKGYVFAILKRTKLLFASGSDELAGMLPEKYPIKLDNFLAYIGALELENIDSIINHNQKLAKEYHRIFSTIESVKEYYSKETIYVRYPIVLKNNNEFDDIVQKLSLETEFSIGRWFNDVIHPKGSFRYCYTQGHCQYGEILADSMINFPMSIHVRVEDIQRNEQAIRKILS
jgi:dTDP-4-amino-4,6-dideoxygalactose transaminase